MKPSKESYESEPLDFEESHPVIIAALAVAVLAVAMVAALGLWLLEGGGLLAPAAQAVNVRLACAVPGGVVAALLLVGVVVLLFATLKAQDAETPRARLPWQLIAAPLWLVAVVAMLLWSFGVPGDVEALGLCAQAL